MGLNQGPRDGEVHSGLSGWALNVITRDLVKGKESVRAEGRMTDQRTSDALSSLEENTNQGILVPTRNCEKGQGMHPPPRTSKRKQICQHDFNSR